MLTATNNGESDTQFTIRRQFIVTTNSSGAVTLSASPALSLPCGFDRYNRPVGLQLVGAPRGEASLLRAGLLFEEALGLDLKLPIDPMTGEVPPLE